MCGIAGVWNYTTREPVDAEVIARMQACMPWRGPDARGSFFRPQHGLGLGHLRLSIIDVAGGDQPISNEAGDVWTIFNGEIYNFHELRAGLLARGHTFQTNSDTEVLVHLYEEKGARLVDDLLGDFAFAIWDDRTAKLLVARDRLGVKPVYYADYDGQLAFASTLTAAAAGSSAPRELDRLGLLSLLTCDMVQGPLSIYAHVHKLLPGHLLTVANGRVRVERYWECPLAPDESRTFDEYAEELRALIRDAVRRQMVADVPLGAFLSGGVDSSTVVRCMTEFANGPVKTFSIGYKEAQYDESPFYKQLAAELGVEHHELVFEPSLLHDVERIVETFGEPCSVASAFPLYHLAALARKHVTVALSGDGPDEIFAGYDLRYRYLEQMQRVGGYLPRAAWRTLAGAAALAPLKTTTALGNRVRRVRKACETLSLPAEQWHLFLSRNRTLQTQPALLLSADAQPDGDLPYVGLFRAAEDPGDWMRAFVASDIAVFLPDEMFVKLDRMTMANSLEGRVPLCDHRIVELAARVPSHMKFANGRGKLVLRRAVQDLLPAAINQRPKTGFRVPLDEWFRDALYPLAHDMLTDGAFRQTGLFEPRAVERLLTEHRAARQNHGRTLWTLVTFELWRRKQGLAAAPPALAAAS